MGVVRRLCNGYYTAWSPTKLHIPIHGCKAAIGFPTIALVKLLINTTTLKDLSFAPVDMDTYLDCEYLFKSLERHQNLRRLSLAGSLHINEDDLVTFMALHARTLRYLVFDGVVLIGKWSSALAAIAEATNGVMEFLGLYRVEEDRYADTEVVQFTEADIKCLKCSVECVIGEQSAENES